MSYASTPFTCTERQGKQKSSQVRKAYKITFCVIKQCTVGVRENQTTKAQMSAGRHSKHLKLHIDTSKHSSHLCLAPTQNPNILSLVSCQVIYIYLVAKCQKSVQNAEAEAFKEIQIQHFA